MAWWPAIPTLVDMGLDSAYDSYGAETYQKIQTYWPAADDPATLPGVLLLHGGGWVGSNLKEHTGGVSGVGVDPTDNNYLAQWLASEAGVYAGSAGYTIDPADTGDPLWPRTGQDVEAAYDWLAARCTGVVAVVGNSSGAWLAAAMRRDADRVLFACPAPGAALTGATIVDRFRQHFQGGEEYVEDRSLWHEPDLGKCRTTLIHGDADATVNVKVARTHAVYFSTRTKNGGTPATGSRYTELVGAGHAPQRDDNYRWRCWALTLAAVLEAM